MFYLAPDRKLMAVAVKTSSAFEPGATRALCETRVTGPAPGTTGATPVTYRYAVSADGQRFLSDGSMEESAPEPITVVLNWQAGLRH